MLSDFKNTRHSLQTPFMQSQAHNRGTLIRTAVPVMFEEIELDKLS